MMAPSLWSTGTETPLFESLAIADVLQIGPNELVQPGGLLRLLAEFRGQAGHFFLKRLAVILNFGCSHVAARGEDVAVPAAVVQRGTVTEAGDVLVLRSLQLRA